MSCRLGRSGLFTVLLLLALGVLALAAAPVVAARAEAQQQEMPANAAMASPGGPCVAMAGNKEHTFGKHAGNCLATCLASQGVVLPVMPQPDTSWQFPIAYPELPRARDPRACSSGLDPPPPRRS